MKKNNIVFFDGVCNVCDYTVDFFLSSSSINFTNFNQSEFKKELIISPPAHIQIRRINPFLFDKKVRKINIMAKELWYGNDSNKDFQLHMLKTIEL
ncbi:hypothetical protein OAG30_00580 [Flavobacteriaceae bacterium]|nr:hypothetical protein [Flavobacteriaceae bacterium]